jgi:uncharacterized protein (DUF433 family)
MTTLADRITVDPAQCGGRPCVRGLRIRVTDVLDLLASGLSPEAVIEELPDLQLEDVSACLRFASRRLAHPIVAAWRDWLDNQLPPALTAWVRATLGVECSSVRDLALQRAVDSDISYAARDAGAMVMTKDADFAALVNQFGAPPPNAHLRQVLGTAWPTVVLMLQRGEPLVEIGDKPR